MEVLRQGSWITAERVRIVGVLMGLTTLTWIGWMALTANGTLDAAGRPIGTDFSNVWTAGWMADHHRAVDAWNWEKHFAVQRVFHGKQDVDLFGWHYPPPFLLIASLLAQLPYVPALVLWQLATLLPLTWLMWRMVPRWETVLLTLAAPVTLICLAHGHNGFLTALLLGGGLFLLERRPLLAGLLLGCLIYKPQFGLVLPVLLLAGGHWRAIAGACLSAALLIGITLAVWGWPVWQAFIDSLPLTRSVIIEHGDTGWEKIMSPFAAVRAWGAPVPAAYLVQSAATLIAIAGVGALAWKGKAPELRNAMCCAAVLLATPYALDYDLVVLLPALAFLWVDGRRHGFLPWDATLMAAAWILPLVARNFAGATTLPLGLLSIVGIAAIALRRSSARD